MSHTPTRDAMIRKLQNARMVGLDVTQWEFTQSAWNEFVRHEMAPLLHTVDESNDSNPMLFGRAVVIVPDDRCSCRPDDAKHCTHGNEREGVFCCWCGWMLPADSHPEHGQYR